MKNKRLEDETPRIHYKEQNTKESLLEFGEFSGEIYYPLKTNSNHQLITDMLQLGLNSFDAASIREVDLIQEISPDSKIIYTHPIKKPHEIIKLTQKGVRIFVADSQSEALKFKLLSSEGRIKSEKVTILIRFSTPRRNTKYNLSQKFGANFAECLEIIKTLKGTAYKIGLAFHVGSQVFELEAYSSAIIQAAFIAKEAKLEPSILDIGGGFPVNYESMERYSLKKIISEINSEFSKNFNPCHTSLIAEPGRALAAESFTLEVEIIDLRKDSIYINDGAYGMLHDAAFNELKFPITETEVKKNLSMKNYTVFGVTCDSLDMLWGTYALNADIKVGEKIYFNKVGAYCEVLRTDFNGYGSYATGEHYE